MRRALARLLSCCHATALMNSLQSRSLQSLTLQAMPPSNNDLPIDRIEKHFDKVMRSDKVPLLKSFGTYLKSLPVRMYGPTSSYERLCKFPFWTKKEEMNVMVKELECYCTMARSVVKYASAPQAAGKTSSVLVAFLESAEGKREGHYFSHYLYIACRNNDERNFRFDVSFLSPSRYRACNQGAAFAFECIKLLLEGHDKEHVSKVDENVPGFWKTVKEMRAYVDDMIPEGRILLHVDEHREMCDDPSKPRKSAEFRRAALTAFARAGRIDVIVTGEEPPLEVEGLRAAADACRTPVAVPRLDVDQVMNAVPEMNLKRRFDPGNFTGETARLWATLYFLLGMKLTSQLPGNNVELMDLHLIPSCTSPNCGVKNEFVQQFDESVSDARDAANALRSCIHLCKFQNSSLDVSNNNTTDVLFGWKEETIEFYVKETKNLVVVKDFTWFLFASLDKLLSMRDSNNGVYLSGRDLLRCVLTMPSNFDVLSTTPLEAAYAWALSFSSASLGSVRCCPRKDFSMKCTKLAPGRFFRNGVDDYDISSLKKDVVYYVNKGEGETCHDLCDIFFRTDDNEIVLIKVYGGQSQAIANDKGRELAEWIERQETKAVWKLRRFAQKLGLSLDQCEFHGVVLAPFVKGFTTTIDGVAVVQGREALQRLHSLAQVSSWLGPHAE